MKNTRKRLAAGLCPDPLGELKRSPDPQPQKTGRGRTKVKGSERNEKGGGMRKGKWRRRKRTGGEDAQVKILVMPLVVWQYNLVD